MSKNELIKIFEEVKNEYGEDYEYFGVRTQDEEFTLGEIDHLSLIWINGEMTEEELDGISCTSITRDETIAARMHSDVDIDHDLRLGYYFGSHCAIIASNSASYGYDINEMILRNAVVVRIIK